MRQIELFQILITTIILMVLTPSLAAQEDVYVDAPIVANQPNAAQAGPVGNFPDQFSFGLINYGFIENIHYQFSEDGIFAGGNSPSGVTNLGWIRIIPLDYQYLPGMAYGAEFMYFTASSEDVYAGEEDVVIGPSINMDMYVTNFKLRLFFMDPVKELLHPFFGLSWGLIFGNLNSTKVGGDRFTTSFFGFSISRNLGIQIKLGERGGLITEMRTISANNVKTSNDPFNRGDGDSVDLDFSGITVALTGYYRF